MEWVNWDWDLWRVSLSSERARWEQSQPCLGTTEQPGASLQVLYLYIVHSYISQHTSLTVWPLLLDDCCWVVVNWASSIWCANSLISSLYILISIGVSVHCAVLAVISTYAKILIPIAIYMVFVNYNTYDGDGNKENTYNKLLAWSIVLAHQLKEDKRITYIYACWKPFEKLWLRMLVNHKTIYTFGKRRKLILHHTSVHMKAKLWYLWCSADGKMVRMTTTVMMKHKNFEKTDSRILELLLYGKR